MGIPFRALLAAAMLVGAMIPSVAGAAPFLGSTGAVPLNSPVVGMAATATGNGYWTVAADGGVFAFGDAPFLGSTGALRLARPVVGMAASPTGSGYWLVAADGGVFAFGDALFYGSTGALRLAAPIVGMAATPSGRGYWLAAADGGVFAFGDAQFAGSTGNLRLVRPVVGMAATATGAGYWVVAADGGVFAFGDAQFAGSTGSLRLNSPIVGMAVAPTPAGRTGYWLVASDGGVFAFGDAGFQGSTGALPLARPVVGMAAGKPGAGGGYWTVASDGGIFAFPTTAPLTPAGDPSLAVSEVAAGLDLPWDLAFTPDATLLFTERAGRLSALTSDGVRRLATLTDVFTSGESGLMGLAVDPEFTANRRIYTCHSWTDGSHRDVRVVAWTVDTSFTSATRVANPLFAGMPLTTGRHAGCRPRFGADGFLWVGTGDGVVGTAPQSLSSLGGKVLRVNKITGAAATDNPFPGSRVFTYGHRNVQGLAMRPSGQVFSAEHGTSRDDEVNLLRPGANGGWDPAPGYNENAPMTDLVKFPDAMRPAWTSGAASLAPSGATFLTAPAWRSFNGALVLACLRGAQLRILFLDPAGALTGDRVLLSGHGRLRTPVQGPDGNLYVTTSNGSGADKILRVTPT